MNHEVVFAVVGAIGLVVIALRRVHQAVAKDLAAADRILALEERALRPRMPPPPPVSHGTINYETGDWTRPAMEDEYFVRHISKGRDQYGQVLESVRINTGQRVPTMPRPTPTARCQWCRVKLTNGECVEGCGGHQ